jgi:hypothetical protein
MTEAEARHKKLTEIRGLAYADLFEGEPDLVFPALQLRNGEDDPFLIDVFAYSMNVEGQDGDVFAAVTNGMSDHRMAEGDEPDQPRRREIIQYFRVCTDAHAKRLRDMAWLPLHDGFLLDTHHTFRWEWPAVEGTPWKNALFLVPLWKTHREFAVEVEGEDVSFLWHIPISDAEWAYRMEHGVDGLIDRMQETKLPWIFDEDDRESLVD